MGGFLAFSDRDEEAAYLAKVWETSLPIAISFYGLMCFINFLTVLGYAGKRTRKLPVWSAEETKLMEFWSIWHGTLPIFMLVARLWLHRMPDALRARARFGTLFVVAYLVRDGTYVLATTVEGSTVHLTPGAFLSFCLIRLITTAIVPSLPCPLTACVVVAASQIAALAASPPMLDGVKDATAEFGVKDAMACAPQNETLTFLHPRLAFTVAILLGLAIGLWVEHRSRLEHTRLTRRTPPLRAASAELDVGFVQHPITLRFRSETEERVFVNQLWLESYETCLALGCTFCMIGFAVLWSGPGENLLVDGWHGLNPAGLPFIIGSCAGLGLRMWVARGHEASVARRLFSQGVTYVTLFISVLLICAKALGVWRPADVPRDLFRWFIALLLIVCAACLPALGLQIEQRCAFVGSVLLGVLSDRLMDEAGRATGPPLLHEVVIVGATVMGLMLGHHWESSRRAQHTLRRQQALHVWAADSRASEAEARANSYKAALAQGKLEKLLLSEQAERDRRNRQADSRLNHVIKGSCGGAMTNVEIVELLITQALGTCRAHVGTCHVQDELTQVESQLLSVRQTLGRVREQLGSTIEWCAARQLFVSLEEGAYTSVASAVPLLSLLEATVGEDGDASVCGEVTTVCCDETVLRLMLAEAVSNARKYRDPKRPIVLRATVRVDKESAAENGNENASAANSETVYSGWIEVEMESVNCEGAAALTTEQLQRVFEPGYRAQAAAASSGVGLDTVAKAAEMLPGGSVWLSTHTGLDERVRTVFHARLPAAPVSRDVGLAHRDSIPPSKWLGATTVGAAAEELNASGSSTPDTAGADADVAAECVECVGDTVAETKALKVIGIDDDPMSRDVQMGLMEHMLHADMARSGALGATSAECERFVDVALGRLDLSLQSVNEEETQPADVVLLDQNIGAHLLGSDIARALRTRGFRGVTCIMTGSSRGDIARLRGLPGVDICVEKGASVLSELPELLKQAMAAKGEKRVY